MSTTLRRTTRMRAPTSHAPTVDAGPRGLPLAKGQRPMAPFVYVHYPMGWEYVSGIGFLPSLKRLTAEPGCNGCRVWGDVAPLVSGAMQRGGTYISPQDPRLGEFQGYCAYYELRTVNKAGVPGRTYVDKWQEPTILPNDQVLWNTAEAGPKTLEFRKVIKDSGIVEPMIVEVAQGRLSEMEQKLGQLEARVGQNPHLKPKIKQLTVDVNAVRAIIAGMLTPIEVDEEPPAEIEPSASGKPKGRKLAPKHDDGAPPAPPEP